MSTPTAYSKRQLRQLIYYTLDHGLLDGALFLAGRLHAYDPRDSEAVHLLALCNLRFGRLKSAYECSREKALGSSNLACAYVFAQACLGLGGHYHEGICALNRARCYWSGRSNWNMHSETTRCYMPDAAAVNCMLGKLWHANRDDEKAIACHKEALKLNPFMWDSLVGLCGTKETIKTPDVFRMTPEMSACLSASSRAPDPPAHPCSNGALSSAPDLSHPSWTEADIKTEDVVLAKLASVAENGHGQQGFNTETALGSVRPDCSEDVTMGEAGGLYPPQAPSAEPTRAPARKTRQGLFKTEAGADAPRIKSISTRSRARSGTESSDHVDHVKPAPAGGHKRTVSGSVANATSSGENSEIPMPVRRSIRIRRTREERMRHPADNHVTAQGTERKRVKSSRAGPPVPGRVISGNRVHVDPATQNAKVNPPQAVFSTNAPSIAAPPKQQQQQQQQQPQPQPQPQRSAQAIEAAREREALLELLELFQKLGEGYYSLSRYSSKPALKSFNSLPSAQRETPWVLSQMGRALYEQAKYEEANMLFEKVRGLAPSCVDDMEIYSTALWHVKDAVALAYLARELIQTDRLSPQAWCAIGNSFSLQRDHDRAIKCFRRATQLDPKFAYAFTLQGHEHIANEELDKAQLAYRGAVKADSRHYNGWYGLGRVFEKMAQYDTAVKHYEAAHKINQGNPVLLVCIGVVQERMNERPKALQLYKKACSLDPRSALARFKMARVLMHLRKTRLALQEMEALKVLAPDEANVHFMLGKLYKMVGDRASAIRHFTVALNLDPKAAQYIKEAMESLEHDEGDCDDDGDDDDDAFDDDDDGA